MTRLFTALALFLTTTASPTPDEVGRWMGQWTGSAVMTPVLFPPCTSGPRVIFGERGIVNFPGGIVTIRGGCQ